MRRIFYSGRGSSRSLLGRCGISNRTYVAPIVNPQVDRLTDYSHALGSSIPAR
jgi:hypothetical protein